MVGIGIDMVYLPEFRRLAGGFGAAPSFMGDAPSGQEANAFVRHTFTVRERKDALSRPDAAEYLAGRFAVKEAVFKALAPHMKGSRFDLRIVESADAENGAPYLVPNEAMRQILSSVGARRILLSVTNENEYVAAVAAAE